MSFYRRPLQLTGTPKHAHRLKSCSQCKADQPPEGGIELGPERWICNTCWGRGAQHGIKNLRGLNKPIAATAAP